jgi:nitronate monooxygenase
MWPNRRLCDLLKIEHPIIQAPMAVSATPALAAAVSNAGGLGSLGCALMTAEEVRTAVREVKAATNHAFNLNFFVHPEPENSADVLSQTIERLKPYYEECGLGAPAASLPAMGPGFDAAKLELVLKMKPPVVSFHFGIPEASMIARLKQAGIIVLSTATTVAEARSLAAGGVDAVIAQGWEAGGHRGSHRPTEPGDGVGTMALVPQVADAIDLPVIAAGGIGDGRGIAAAFALGASGVQLGTSFLSCREAGTDPRRRALLKSASDTDTMVTDAFSGRSARAWRTRYAAEMERRRMRLPDFPAMYVLSGPLSEAERLTESDDFAFHLFGQAAALNRDLPAAELMRLFVCEAQTALRTLAAGTPN